MVDIQTGTGGTVVFNYDESIANSEQAFFFVEQEDAIAPAASAVDVRVNINLVD